MVEFISYNGKYPNLCRGQLVLKIDGEIVEFPRYCMASGGNVWFDDEWMDHVDDGEWEVDIPDEYAKYKEKITEVVNENVPQGCCGGCI